MAPGGFAPGGPGGSATDGANSRRRLWHRLSDASPSGGHRRAGPSPAMVAVAQSRLPAGVAVVGDALNLPFADGAFDHVLTGYFYGHLPLDERTVFLSEARRVAGELVVIDTALRPGVEPEQWVERMLNNGSRHRIYKRYLTSAQLTGELGGEVLFEGQSFVAARVTWSNPS
ncbi:class I SAM-dependent methyltransferase [Nonomuraea sp. NPDC049695]|uniref:class I SAM-dependent methyltransferase n=1 Tax=Nonomuraea sp. NPDC049695 TaxID=3154734 RepID=UPI003424C4DB